MVMTMQLNKLTINDDIKHLCNDVLHKPFNGFVLDTRQLQTGDVFVLLKSQTPNAIADYAQIQRYLDDIAHKAVFVLSEIPKNTLTTDLPFVYLPNIRQVLGDWIKLTLHNNTPLPLPTIIATTGTNGKTTISQLTAQLIAYTGRPTAVMGTAGNGILPNLKAATHTTPDVLALHSSVHSFAKQGVHVLSLEASSHGLDQHRLQGLGVQVAIFSNLSRDHLDYHADMDDYATAKARLFDKAYFPALQHAIINSDDEYADLMIKTAKRCGVSVWTYSLNDKAANFVAKKIAPSFDGVELMITTPKGDLIIKSPLLGRFNVANLLASIAAAMAVGLSLTDIAHAVPHLQGATGRMDKVASQSGLFIVDYAHTPDALEQVLASLKGHCTGKLWAVFGCGGDRDKGKRPLMTQAALQWADKVILTADNPRTEDPLAILNDMQAGITSDKIHQEPDRRRAIGYAVEHAGDDDIVVIAGKGHESYQEIQGIRYDFDDKVVLRQMIDQFGR